jgi:HAMP domain-containing protein
VKIIAAVNAYTFLVEANVEELVRIAGRNSSYGMPADEKPAVGKTIEVNDLWNALTVSVSRRDDIAKLAESLRKEAGRIDTINQALANPIVMVKA